MPQFLSQLPSDFAHTHANLANFLTAKGSLTALLEQVANQPLRVKIVQEGHRALTFAQKKQLGLDVNRPQIAWVRTVQLYGASDRAWVMASSIFPLKTLQGELNRLRHLGSTPIGYVLFKKHRTLPHTRRLYRTIDGEYGRSTLYEHHGKKLLIDELFLAEFCEFLQNQ